MSDRIRPVRFTERFRLAKHKIQEKLRKRLIERKIREVQYMVENFDPSKIPEMNGQKLLDILSFEQAISPFDMFYIPAQDGRGLDIIPFSSTILTIRKPMGYENVTSSHTFIIDHENQQVYALGSPIYTDPNTSFLYVTRLLNAEIPPKPQRQIIGLEPVDQIKVLDSIQSILEPAIPQKS